jgi:hypothetical protein
VPSAAEVGAKEVVLLSDDKNGNPDVNVLALLLMDEELTADDISRLTRSTEPSSLGVKMYTVLLASSVPCPEAIPAEEPGMRIVVGMYGRRDVSEAEEACTAGIIRRV